MGGRERKTPGPSHSVERTRSQTAGNKAVPVTGWKGRTMLWVRERDRRTEGNRPLFLPVLLCAAIFKARIYFFFGGEQDEEDGSSSKAREALRILLPTLVRQNCSQLASISRRTALHVKMTVVHYGGWGDESIEEPENLAPLTWDSTSEDSGKIKEPYSCSKNISKARYQGPGGTKIVSCPKRTG